MKKQGTHWRRLNPYGCTGCGKKRYTLVFKRAKDGLCRSCRKNKVPEGQDSLFQGSSDVGITITNENVAEVFQSAMKKLSTGTKLDMGV